ncbi:hypothetical protein P2Q70_18760 [Pseudomonas mendocina]|uniref:hypothetical protein n=1 Tax=Ectopseudomonas mendocina TaxID=300 RepID=UPI0023D981DB|nr:hypothetical protein [Pseudomonas mendocina]MDF2076630.1 hypothetical protein [Pseudomonas mendocina]
MSNEKVLVLFTQSWRGYSKGEKACFDDGQAKALVDGKVAELVKAGKASAEPAAAATTGKGSGKGGAAKAGSSGVAPEPGADDDTPPAPDTPPADDDQADDNEKKP